MFHTFTEWLKLRESDANMHDGWSKRWKEPAVGFGKDMSPEHPKNAVDPEHDPHSAERGVHHHKTKRRTDVKLISPGGAVN